MTEKVRNQADTSIDSEALDSFPGRVAELADEAGSASALARLCDVSESVVRKWGRGTSDPSRSNLIAMARAMEVNLAWLASGEGPKRSSHERMVRDAFNASLEALSLKKKTHQEWMSFGWDTKYDDETLMEVVVRVETQLHEMRFYLSPNAKAWLVDWLYQYHANTGRKPDVKLIRSLLKDTQDAVEQLGKHT